MGHSATAITNLLYHYADRIDAGDLDGAAALFRHARVKSGGEVKDEAAGTATCRSYYTVLQATPELPLQAVAAGRYHDRFERVDGEWRFSFRDYSLFDLPGNLSQHLMVMPETP